jgi:outer membrane receptor protein involved in Fe transport
LSLVGRNLTNKYYLLFAADRTGGTNVDFPGVGQQRGVVARGREVALQLGVKF